MLAAVALAACSAPAAGKKELTAQEIVDNSSEKIQALKSVHFRLEVADGKMSLGLGITVDNVEGDAALPGRMRIKSKASFGGVVFDVDFISVDGKQYFRNPLTGRWETLPIAVAATNLFDRDKGAVSVMKGAINLTKLANETMDGVESYHLRGTVEASALASIVGAVPSESQVQVDTWIGTSDFLVRQIRIEGALLQGDAAQAVRTLKLSRFDEPVTIEPPA